MFRREHSTQLTEQSLKGQRLASKRIKTEDATLLVIDGPHKGHTLHLEEEIVLIGRGNWCDLVLAKDRQISKEHAELRITEEGIVLRDLNSRNGVFLNQIRVLEAFLPDSAVIQVGESTLQLQTQAIHKEITVPYHDKSQLLVGCSSKMRKIFSMMARLGPQDIPIVLTGETGTGKTSMARAIHEQSARHKGPFVIVNCGALSPSLIEGLFFGYEKGAFTGAAQKHRGFFEQADGGTLFLDELGELPLELQPKLLDVLERGKVRRLGGEREQTVNFRLISSTHRDLGTEVESGHFRRDLFYRVAVSEIHIPPL